MDKGSEEIFWEGKDLHNSRKLRMVVTIPKANKLVFSKMYLSLKTRG